MTTAPTITETCRFIETGKTEPCGLPKVGGLMCPRHDFPRCACGASDTTGFAVHCACGEPIGLHRKGNGGAA